MSIPLSRLYDHLYHKSNHDILIYGWIPHGSKKLEDLIELNSKIIDWTKRMTTPMMVMHDQEPLNFNLWSDDDFAKSWEQKIINENYNQHHRDYKRIKFQVGLHLRGITSPSSNLYDQVIIVHSEQNSDQIVLYQQNGFLPVYYWSHALIAADWFRYAAHDSMLDYNFNLIDIDFLIYNRAWTGTREYRLTFAELLVATKINEHCLTSFSAIDNDQYYSSHKFVNPKLAIQNNTLHTILSPNTYTSSASADYASNDYARVGMEVVLETLFDDDRWHLTEKTLRPIACGKPFMLAAAAGSLKYLKNYGFETFSNFIDEDYDNIIDPKERLQAIVTEMQRISALPATDKQLLWNNLHAIAKRNKNRFFSQHWQASIEQEFYSNLDHALGVMKQHCTGKYWAKSKTMLLSAGSANRSAEEIQKLNDWIADRN